MKSKQNKKKDIVLKIRSKNINGLAHRLEDAEFSDFLETSKNEEQQIIDFSATKLNWHSARMYKKMKSIFKYSYIGGNMITETSLIPMKRNYKPGGVTICLYGTIRSITQDHGKDQFGRWAWFKMACNKNYIFYFLQLYVPIIKFRLYSTATQLLHKLLREKPSLAPDIMDSYEHDLFDFLDSIGQNHILISGDFNMEFKDPFLTRLLQIYDLSYAVDTFASEEQKTFQLTSVDQNE